MQSLEHSPKKLKNLPWIIAIIPQSSKHWRTSKSLQVWPLTLWPQINSGNTAHCIVLRKIRAYFFFLSLPPSTKYVLWIPGMASQAHSLVFLCSLWIIYVGGGKGCCGRRKGIVHVCTRRQVCSSEGASSILIKPARLPAPLLPSVFGEKTRRPRAI